ncbi:MAG TPA: putative sugar nucleotidyl transferase, partial [Phycisphaerae bacterium]|nr:putative sugar nucleotidyl transferase [Phycisphaerae bacterium]
MAPLILFEDHRYRDFLPLAYWHSLMGLLCGRKMLMDHVTFVLRQPLSGLWMRSWIADVTAMRCQMPVNRPVEAGALLVNGRWLLDHAPEFRAAPYVGLCGGDVAYIACDAKLAAAVTPEVLLDPQSAARLAGDFPSGEVDAELAKHPWDLTAHNSNALRRQWTGDDRGSTGNVSSSAFLMNPDQIHVGDRSRVRPTAVIDAGGGPVYISNDVRIDVHTYIEGPVYIGPGSIVKPHASIRAGTSLGSMCRVE